MNTKSIPAAALSFVMLWSQTAVAQDNSLAVENFQQADADGSRSLTYDEFVTLIDLNAQDGFGNAARVSERDLYARAFDRLDRNADKLLTPDELQSGS